MKGFLGLLRCITSDLSCDRIAPGNSFQRQLGRLSGGPDSVEFSFGTSKNYWSFLGLQKLKWPQLTLSTDCSGDGGGEAMAAAETLGQRRSLASPFVSLLFWCAGLDHWVWRDHVTKFFPARLPGAEL